MRLEKLHEQTPIHTVCVILVMEEVDKKFQVVI